MAQTFPQWIGSVLFEQARAVPDPAVADLTAAVAALKEEITMLHDSVQRNTAATDAAVAKVADLTAANATLTSDNAAKAATIADLQAQLDAAKANAADPADIAAIDDNSGKLETAVNPPATETTPVEQPATEGQPADPNAPVVDPNAPAVDPNAPAPDGTQPPPQ